jgi:predicted MFS family arabinose efflux permease
MLTQKRPFGQNYAFVVVAVIFITLLVSAASRAVPGVLMVPLQDAFGWGRDTISLSAAIGIFLYGLSGPFSAALMERIGVRRTLIGALTLMAVSTGASSFMTEPWQFILTWGIFSGIGSGALAIVLGATIVNRWFVKNRGLMMGLLTASTATGTLAFLPAMAALAQSGGWRPVVIAVSIAAAALIPLAYFLVPDRPDSIGLVPYGADPATAGQEGPTDTTNFLQRTINTLTSAAKTRTFWLLFATFFICGFTTNGLVGTHLIALCSDRGMLAVQAAGLLAVMGIFDLIGTTASGWLTDRFDPRKLLMVYYTIRGLSLLYLPYSDFSIFSLGIFAVLYGLDWIATVPPTLRLANETFGDRSGPLVFGWIVAGHQVGAATAAVFGGYVRELQGDYSLAFLVAGVTGLVAAGIAIMIDRKPIEGFGMRVPAAA